MRKALIATRVLSLLSPWSTRLRVSLAATLIATSVAGGLAPAHASVVIAEVTGTIGGADQSPGNAISFTTTSAFTDVTISALLYTANFTTGGAATVYLTDSIGSLTTSANELAQVSVTDLPFQFSTSTPEVVFTGLSLPAGTYYVIEASDAGSPGASWGAPESANETTAPGVTINSLLQASSLLPGNSPASDFVADSDFQFAFSITGSPVPEPSTWAMMLIGFAGLGFAGYRTTRGRRSITA
jgi:hypothetical protein